MTLSPILNTVLCVTTVATLLFVPCFYFYLHTRFRRHTKQIITRHNAQLHSTEKKYEELIESLSDAFLLIDSSSLILFANRAALRLFQNRHLLNRPLNEVFINERLSSFLQKSITNNQASKNTFFLNHYQPSRRTSPYHSALTAWEVDFLPLDHGSHSAPLYRVLIQDTTKQNHTEQIRKDFISNASHELKTPITIINGYLENLLDQDGALLKEDSSLSLKFLQTIKRNGERMSHLIEHMLLISKMESVHESPLNKQSFTLLQCLQEVQEHLSPLIQKTGSNILLDIQPTTLQLKGDYFYFFQIFFNLIENALKENAPLKPPNVNSSKPLLVSISAVQTTDSTVITVSDNGIGISSADLPFIFKRFFRSKKHHNQSLIEGTGLGLSIVKRAVEAHQGTISARSIPNQRTSFTITLPS